MVNKKIGVYICHCGGNISDYVDVNAVKKAVENIPGVALVKTVMFACADSTQQEIIKDIKDYKLDAIVVASCSPKLHLHTFRRVAEQAGLNPYKYIQANIREQVSWAHSDDPKGATEKAINVVKGAITRAKLAVELEPIKVKAIPAVLIIGAGISGLRAALAFSQMGIKVYCIEKSPFVGGRVAQWGNLYPDGSEGRSILSNLIAEIKKRDNITIFTNAELVEKSGSAGNFSVKIKIYPRFVIKNCDRFHEAIQKCPVEVPDDFNFGLTKRKAIYKPYENAYPELPAIDKEACNKCGECVKVCGDAIDLNQKESFVELKVGAILVMTGFDPYTPKVGEFGYGNSRNIITLQELERILDINHQQNEFVFQNQKINNVAFIYCVGSRQKKEAEKKVNEYCSRYCCTAAIFMALNLIKRFPYLNIYHLFRDIRTYGKNELFYEAASRNGNVFIKYDENDPPTVTLKNGSLVVSVNDMLTNREHLEIPVDLVVLVTGMIPRSNENLSNVLKIPTGRDGFFNEVHPKLKPVETVISGIYIAGAAQGPKNIQESISSALSAVSKSSSWLMKGEIRLEPNIASVDEDLCVWCGKCLEACPYEAITKISKDKKEVAYIKKESCKGCGACVPVCPVDAIQIKGYTDREIMEHICSMIKAGGANE
jgi:heterodisulfide reductase subunit A